MGGGYILIGIAEDKGRPVLPPVGLDSAQIDAIQKELLNLGFSAIAPYYHPIAVPVEIKGRHVLVLWALGGATRPYKAKISLGKDSKDYAYYIRKGSSTIRAKGADETELMSLAATVPHDDRINQQAKMENLSRELMQDYLQQVGSDLAGQAPTLSLVELGRQMGVIGGPEEAPFPLNVGLMMFNPEPWRFFPAMQIDVVWFPKEGPGGNKFSEKVFKGTDTTHDPRCARLHQAQPDYRDRHQASRSSRSNPCRKLPLRRHRRSRRQCGLSPGLRHPRTHRGSH
jgi:ATP-dependent DNA helicase RecG